MVRFSVRLSEPLCGFYNSQALGGAWKLPLMLAQLHEQGSVARARPRGRSDFAWSTTVFRSPRSRRNIAALSRADADRVEEMFIRPPRTQAAGLGRERVQWWAQGRADVVAVPAARADVDVFAGQALQQDVVGLAHFGRRHRR